MIEHFPLVRELSLVVVGADYPNKRGPARRFEIALCRPGEPVELRPEPNNPADPRAVAVFSARNIQIGYVSAERAQWIRAELTRGEVTSIFQSAEPWGATIRVGLRGDIPAIPVTSQQRCGTQPPPGSDDERWWPDDMPDYDE